MKIFHVYEPDYFEGLVKNNFLNEDTGLKVQHIFTLHNRKKFNTLAAKGSALYELIKKERYPLYIDRLTGGVKYHPYAFDKELFREYRSLLGEWFLGAQLHEIGNNRYNDWIRLMQRLGDRPYTLQNIQEVMFSPESTNPQNMPIYRFTQGSPEEFAALSRPLTIEATQKDLYDTIVKRLQETDGNLISCDGGSLLFQLEHQAGVPTFMPEIGYQTQHTRIQIALARGMAKAYGKKWGVYYECWKAAENGGSTYTQPVYGDLPYNDWNYTQDQFGDDFTTCGENGGSSRLLQRRIYFHALMSGAEFFAEEWGFVRSFYNMETYDLSPYGKVKKEFIDFARNHKKMRPVTPFAIVLPTDLCCLHVGTGFKGPIGTPCTKFLRVTPDDATAARFGKIHDVIKTVFQGEDAGKYGNEGKTLQNSKFGDLFDIIYADAPEDALKQYDLLIDADPEDAFLKANPALPIVSGKDLGALEETLRQKAEELLPLSVDQLHWILSEDEHGRYLTLFNNEGNHRTIKDGDTIDPRADATATVTIKDGAELSLLYSSAPTAIQKIKDGIYRITVPAAQLAVFRLQFYSPYGE